MRGRIFCRVVEDIEVGIHEAMGAKLHPIAKARIQSRIPSGVVLFQWIAIEVLGAMGGKF